MTDGDQHGEKLAALEKVLLDESTDPVDIPFSILKSITGNFSEAQKIGRGGYGEVYKGVFPSGRTFAVKKLFERYEILDKNFESEVACLVGVKHKNMVRFLGYCSETQHVVRPYDGKLVWADVRQRLLCFVYLPGCLADYLSDASCQPQWTRRYQIIKGICEGVYYLHQLRIIHMDLKPQNVLLDDHMVPRIADFGLSRRLSGSHSRAITENKLGTLGYMAPEFITNGEITFKTDIYSLGVIIMEILMGRKGCSDVNEVLESWKTKFGTSKSQTAMEQVKVCAEIGIKCTEYDPDSRPTTLFIIREILGEAEISNWPATSGVTSTKTHISFVLQLGDGLKLTDDSAAPPQLQPSSLEVEQEDGKMNQEWKGKESTVSVLIGAMSILSGKLTMVMGDKYNKQKEVRKETSFLEKDLSTINATLKQLELMDELSAGVNNWTDNLTNIFYDMENCIDDFMRQFGDEDVEAGFIENAAELHKRLCELNGIVNQIEELRTLVVEANARHDSEKIEDCKTGYGYVVVHPRLPVVFQEATNLVGIDEPREEVVNWLMDTQKKLKVVSIVGFGGLGKTTLAKQVFDKIRGQFNCAAFISVSQRPDMRVLLNCLQLKLGIEEPSHDHGFVDIIEQLRKYLANKRYLIVVDDLWGQSAWKTISCAFPENQNESRIIVTTQLEDVASMACHNDLECIYTMKTLNEENAKKLFSNRVFGSEVVCPPHLKDVAAEILKKCGGFPLAIVTIASLLATQLRSRKHWESIRKSLGAQSSTNLALNEMKHILNISYMHLPLHLEACFLYLGMYPENHIIPRDDLVKQWIVEGFVSSLHGLDLSGVGRSYFNELVDRNMIQPSKNQYGEVLSCTVHNMMLDLILRKCIEDNFISVAYSSEDMGTLLHDCKYKVNRLSLRSMAISGAIYDTDIAASMSQVRSFILFENPISPLSWFKYLRMVIIIDSGNKMVDLTAISQLFQLTYLMVKVRGQIDLPNELGELVYLETLDIANCKLIKSFPLDIVHLPRLSYLALPDFTDLPEGIENMKSMRTLHGFDLKKSSLKCVMGLGELANLRELSMKTHHYFRTSKLDALACSIGKLRNLEHLCIFGYHFEDKKNQQLGSLSNPFQHIERLGLRFWELCRVPEWMSGLHCLRFLELVVNKTSTEEVHLLGELPCLAHLDFGVSEFPDERAILGAGLFPVLEFFYFHSRKDTTAYLGFEPGTMPNLRTLWLDAYGWRGTIPVGMEHLLHLQHIEVYGTSSFIKSAFKAALLVHPNRPCVNGKRI